MDAGEFHSFHLGFCCFVCAPLNQGVLPKGYYAHVEKVSGVPLTELLTKPIGEPQRVTEIPYEAEGACLADDPP